ncbi:MAG: VWA domain-containing protein [Gammaproteobacteria bacterium]|nr:VWA domain-containing protein [Gammaproteobacteria bacterium]
MLQLATPLWLLALPLPWLLWQASMRFIKDRAEPHRPAIIHPQTALLSQLSNSASVNKQPPWFWLIGCMLLITALCRPQWFSVSEHQGQGRDFMLAIDLSGSMRALDYTIDNTQVSRLDMLKRVVTEFLNNRQGDRAGLIIFADDAFTLTPITTDLGLLKTLIGQIRNGIAGEKTALGTAMMLAVKRLQDHEHPNRILILFTDGTNTAGIIQPLDAALLAHKHGIRIYTVGIGSQGAVPFPRGPIESPEMAELPLDETTLRDIATETGGRYYHAIDIESMQQIIKDIERLETLPIEENPLIQPQEIYSFPLGIGLGLLLIPWFRGSRNTSN